VREVETHGDEEPVEWTLVTTEPIDSPQAVERIVDAYRARWVIEEYLKVIKSGCAYEKRQLESFETLINALAIFIPIAWRLLLLRTLARKYRRRGSSNRCLDSHTSRSTGRNEQTPLAAQSNRSSGSTSDRYARRSHQEQRSTWLERARPRIQEAPGFRRRLDRRHSTQIAKKVRTTSPKM
jgi:hypothetical protein